MLRRLDTNVFAVSKDVREHLVAEGFHREEVSLIYNGIDVGAESAPNPTRPNGQSCGGDWTSLLQR